jgi:hypothetical protein
MQLGRKPLKGAKTVRPLRNEPLPPLMSLQ